MWLILVRSKTLFAVSKLLRALYHFLLSIYYLSLGPKPNPCPIMWTDGWWLLVKKWRKGDLWKIHNFEFKFKNDIVVVY